MHDSAVMPKQLFESRKLQDLLFMIEIVITMKPDFTLHAYLTIKIMRKSAMKNKYFATEIKEFLSIWYTETGFSTSDN